jgi:hypothetical protein
LQNHALGISEELSQSRLKAIEILLRKSVPDLSQMQLTGDKDAPLQVVQKIVLEPLGDDRSDSATS